MHATIADLLKDTTGILCSYAWAEAILRIRSRSSLPEAPYPFLPVIISGLNFSYRA